MGLKLNGATSGSVELDVPAAVGSDLQLTLPATAGTALVAPGSTSITVPSVDGTLDRLEREGNILQVVSYQRVNATSTLAAVTSGTGYVPMMSKDITTIQANSKIKIYINFTCYAGTRGSVRLRRDSTTLYTDPYAHYTDTSTLFQNYNASLIDSPSVSAGTTISYNIQVASGSGTMHFGYGDSGGGGAVILLLTEIAA